MPLVSQLLTPSISQSAPADPTGTTDTTGKMMGLAVAFTPNVTGRVLILVTGNLTNSTATAGDGAKAQIRYGTGAAPANAAALTGTAIGSILTSVLERATASDLQPLCLVGVASGLTVGTQIWVDLGLAAIVGGTGQVKNLNVVIIEL